MVKTVLNSIENLINMDNMSSMKNCRLMENDHNKSVKNDHNL